MYKIETEAKGLVSHGVNACAGCGLELVFRTVIRALGEDTIVIIPPGCAALFSGIDNVTNIKIAGYQCNLENTAASAAAGLRWCFISARIADRRSIGSPVARRI